MSMRDTDPRYGNEAPEERKHHAVIEGNIMRSTHPDDSKKAWIVSDYIVDV